jgi:hypothetical protein
VVRLLLLLILFVCVPLPCAAATCSTGPTSCQPGSGASHAILHADGPLTAVGSSAAAPAAVRLGMCMGQ